MATAQKGKVIPGVDLSALDAITDANTREVLRALIDGWQVRNGNSGSGDHRFVTAAEVGLVKGNSAIGGYRNNLSNPANTVIKPADIARIINDLQAQVIESPLFKLLGERVDLIDTPGGLFSRVGDSEIAIRNETETRTTADTAFSTALTAVGVRVGQAEAATQTQITLRTNSDNALASAVNTLWAAVGNNSGLVQSGSQITANTAGAVASNWNQVQAAIRDASGNVVSSSAVKQTAEAAVNKAGQLEAKYTVKIDANGYVSGYGLASTANNATPYSSFIVRADNFAIGSPSGPGITPQVPFIVRTTPSYVNGQYVPPGVYMQEAFIANGTIGRAKIGHAEIDTLLLAGNSVTVPLYFSGVGGASNVTGNTVFEVASIWGTYADTVDIVAVLHWQASAANLSGNTVGIIKVDGVTFGEWANSGIKSLTSSHSMSAKAHIGAGSHRFSFHVRNGWHEGSWDLQAWSVMLLGVMR